MVDPSQALKKIFIEELKTSYRDVSNNLRPMPFNKEKRFLVDQLFIDSGIHVLIRDGIKTSWQKLDSFHSMFESKVTSTKTVLSSKAGYGKSTLALKFVSDWTNKNQNSPLGKVEILIHLRLKQFDSSVSVSKAIKTYLLPNKSRLRQEDVEKILLESKSVVMVLEGFDKYKQKGKPEDDDVISILKCRMFPDFRVILTTTLSCKPDFMDPTTTEITLGGFDSEDQKKYIRKALVIDDEKALAKVEHEISENPIMKDLGKVPFIFATVLFLIQEKRENRRPTINFQSITDFFRYVIALNYQLLKEKMRKEDCSKYEKFKVDHYKLDRLCFENLTEENEVKYWIKDDLEEKIGSDLYDYYIAFEILVQEEVYIVDTSPYVSTRSLIKDKTHTEFRHELLGQWFAAQYLAQRATRTFKGYSDRQLKTLLDKDLRYVFAFACGINPQSTNEIVSFLKRQGTGRRYKELIELCNREKNFCQYSI